MKKITLIITLLFFVTGCATKIYSFDKYKRSHLSNTDFMPSVDMVKGKKPKVVIFPLDNQNINIAKKVNLGSVLAVNIENILTEDKLVDLIDRNSAKKLKKEIQLSEIHGNKTYKGPIVASLAVGGVMNKAEFAKQHTAARHKFDFINMAYEYAAPMNTYKATVGGNIKIYEIPSLRVIRTISFDHVKTYIENVEKENYNKEDTRKTELYLLKQAAQEAVKKVKIDLKNIFARKGYILEKRKLRNSYIFKINLGSDDGMQKGNRFNLLTKIEEANALTEETEITEVKLYKGKITNKINKKSCWIKIKNKKIAQKIRLGDFIQIEYKKGWFRR